MVVTCTRHESCWQENACGLCQALAEPKVESRVAEKHAGLRKLEAGRGGSLIAQKGAFGSRCVGMSSVTDLASY